MADLLARQLELLRLIGSIADIRGVLLCGQDEERDAIGLEARGFIATSGPQGHKYARITIKGRKRLAPHTHASGPDDQCPECIERGLCE